MITAIPQKGLSLVVFIAKWCRPCVGYHKTLDEVKAEGVNVVEVDVDDNGGLAAEYRIMSVPQTMLFHDGAPVTQWLGVQQKSTLVDAWNSATTKISEAKNVPT